MICIQFISKYISVLTKYDLICLRPYLRDKYRMPECNSESLSLSDRIMRNPFMFSDYSSVCQNKISRRWYLIAAFPVNKSGIIIVRDKADLLTVLFYVQP